MIEDCVDLDALEQDARRRMPPASWVFCDTGADDEITAKDNITAWRRLRLRPRVLRDIVDVDASVILLGSRVKTPIMVAPTGRHHLFHAEGERATARGTAAAGALFVMSTSGATKVEDVAAERGAAPQWFQLYMQPDRDATGALRVSGGRVFAVTALAGSVKDAARVSAAASARIAFDGKTYRRDIAWREIARAGAA